MLCSSSGGFLVTFTFFFFLLSSLLFHSSEARTIEEHGVGRRLDDDLARAVDADPEAFWARVTGALRGAVQEQSDRTLEQWKRTVGGDYRKIGVSSKCAKVLEYMIRQPLEEEWTARSELFGFDFVSTY